MAEFFFKANQCFITYTYITFPLSIVINECCPGFIPVVIKLREERFYFGSQFQVTVHPCGEIKAGISNIIHSKEQRAMNTHVLTHLLASA